MLFKVADGIEKERSKMFLKRKTRDLPVAVTDRLEHELQESVLGQDSRTLSDEEVAKRFNLSLEIDDSLPYDTEAVLDKPDRPDVFGTIRVKQKYKASQFSCVHEIIHYVFDVGPGKSVETKYTRKAQGYTQDLKEQKTNYMAAAYIIPYDKLYNDLREFYQTYPRDESRFIVKMCKKYNQPRVAVLRRIREIKRLAASRKQSLK